MTNIVPGSDLALFQNENAIVEYLLKNVLANKNQKIGTEWEMFLVNQDGKAINRADGQKAFTEFKRVFALKGYKTSYVYEEDAKGHKTIFGLNINGLGMITPEMGHQFEFSCSVSENIDEIREKNEEFYGAIQEVARRLNYTPVFRGHIPGYIDTTEGSYRSRSTQWHDYFAKRFGQHAKTVRETLDATASTQVTIDSGAERFHEFFKALLLIEPAFTLHFANSDRPYIGTHNLPSSHMKPIVEAWRAANPREALEIITKRLMEVEVPFLPDPDHPDIYKAEPFINGHPPTIRDLMEQGRLNEKTFNNAGGFLLARPAIRRFSQALLEMRGVDSQSTPEQIAGIAQRVTVLLYNDAIRTKLLNDYAHLSVANIQALHNTSAMSDKDMALKVKVAGIEVSDFVADIISRSDEISPHGNLQPVYRKTVRKILAA